MHLQRAPVFAIHFFDWYKVTPEKSMEEFESSWTHKALWEKMGIDREEVGNTVNYYHKQFEMIETAGFDGVLWEWHSLKQPGGNLSQEALEALADLDIKFGLFYDMEIRYHPQPSFITPRSGFLDGIVDDVSSFYCSLPREKWFYDCYGRLPMVFYGYQFNTSVTDTKIWHYFYAELIGRLKEKLGSDVTIHWTWSGHPQQIYAYQHFEQIKSFAFNMAHEQTAYNADSVTIVLNYDDLGVYKDRRQDLVIDDVRYIEEGLWMAKNTDPSLVFFYGWNELYEGEALVPDEAYGDFRYDLSKSIIEDIRVNSRSDIKRTVIVTDDILSAWGHLDENLLGEEMKLLNLARTLLPGTECIISGQLNNDIAEQNDIIFCINLRKSAEEETLLDRLVWPKVIRTSQNAPFNWHIEPFWKVESPDRYTMNFYGAEKDKLKKLFESLLGERLNDGILTGKNYTVASEEQITYYRERRLSMVRRERLPIERYVFVAPRMLDERKFLLPLGFEKCRFSFLRGVERPIEIEDGNITLRWPEVVEITSS